MFPNIYIQLHRIIIRCLFKRCSSTMKDDSNSNRTTQSNEHKETDTVSTTSSTSTETTFPEEPTTCCMSGCANCVWLEYAEKISEYFKDGGEAAIREIEERVQDPNIKAFLLTELRMRMKQQK